MAHGVFHEHEAPRSGDGAARPAPQAVTSAVGQPSAAGPLASGTLTSLQRAIGNRAVNDLIAHRAPPTLQRAPGWRDVDAQADDRRLAHARDGYLFDKSLKGPDEGVTPGDRRRSAEAHEATTARLAGQGVDARSNDVPWPPATAFFFWKYREDPGAAVAHYVKANKLAGTKQQVATIHARAKAKANIPPPESVLAPEAVAAHLGKFANGAHAFIDPSASKKIEGEITDPRFKGWGVDANFVAPLDEANALNAKAHAGAGIETIEEELGIPGKYWSKTEWNPRKQLVRWIIPKPKLAIDAGDDEVSLEMAKGTEWGADSALWVAGGLTKGGASEAVLKAIPRPQLIKMLAKGTIRQVTETYPETRDGIT